SCISYFSLHSVRHSCPLYGLCYHRDLHSFPTRRSSDLMTTLSAVGIEAVKPESERDKELKRLFEANAANESKISELQAKVDAHTDRKSTRLNSSHEWISYAVFCLKKKKKKEQEEQKKKQ